MAADSEISLLARSSTPMKATQKTWSSYPAEEEVEEVGQPGVKFPPLESDVPSTEPQSLDTTSASSHKASAQSKPTEGTPAKLILSFDASQTSIRSTDTTLEYFDAPLSNEQDEEEVPSQTDDDNVVTVNLEPPPPEQSEERLPPSAEQQPLQAAECAVGEEEQEKEELVEVEEEGGEEKVQSVEADKQDAASPDQSNPFIYSRGRMSHRQQLIDQFQSCAGIEEVPCHDFVHFVRQGDGPEVESQHDAVQPLRQDVQCEPTETGFKPEEDADQSAGLLPSKTNINNICFIIYCPTCVWFFFLILHVYHQI